MWREQEQGRWKIKYLMIALPLPLPPSLMFVGYIIVSGIKIGLFVVPIKTA